MQVQVVSPIMKISLNASEHRGTICKRSRTAPGLATKTRALQAHRRSLRVCPVWAHSQDGVNADAEQTPSHGVHRRTALSSAAGAAIGGLGAVVVESLAQPGRAVAAPSTPWAGSKGPTNEVVRVVNGIRHKRLGGSDLVVSEVGLGAQRWASADFNAPDEATCRQFMDRAILDGGVNLIDTAEQYPIPSDRTHPEGLSEEVIGRWMKGRREKVILATKITGGAHITPVNIVADCESSLRRLGTDYIDLYQFHWPARYSPQANWGQSLAYQYENENPRATSFEAQCKAIGKLLDQGKIRAWGLCNDNAVGLVALAETAKRMGIPPPCSMMNDFSLINRRVEENGVTEASSPLLENCGFLAYNALAGGVLTGKYLDGPPAAWDDLTAGNERRAAQTFKSPRGRMDDPGWSPTLYRYRSAAAAEATAEYAALAKQCGISLTELSLLWARSRRGVTSVLLGCSNMAQLEEDLRYFDDKRALLKDVFGAIDAIHMRNRLPIFSNDSYDGSNWSGRGKIREPIP